MATTQQSKRRVLQAWLSTPEGARARQAEQTLLAAAIGDRLIPQALVLGVAEAGGVLPSKRIVHCWRLAEPDLIADLSDLKIQRQAIAAMGINGIGEPTRLPFFSDTFNLVVVRHLFEFEHDHRGLLLELKRILRPQGQLLILGFDPSNPNGLGAWARGLVVSRFRAGCCAPHFAGSVRRVAVASGFEFSHLARHRYRVPWRRGGWGGCYLLALNKSVIGLTPLRSSMSTRRIRVGAAEPARRQTA